jgi:hypothetical protein
MADTRLPGFYHLVLIAFMAFGLSACGGGGGAGDPGFIGGGVDDPAGPSNPVEPGDPGTNPSVSLVLTLTDIDGNPTTSITSVSPGTLNVSVTDSQGQAVPSVVVSASVSIGTLPVSSALTDLNGQVALRLEAGLEVGAGTATVSAGTATESVNYQIGAANLRIGRISGTTFVEGEIEAGATLLPAAGSTPLSVTVVDVNDTPVAASTAVIFGSSCASLAPPLADVTPQVITVGGVATATYTATGCSGPDTATATIVQGNAQSATVTLDIASATVNSIAFLSATPTQIALKGTGGAGRLETSDVAFQVLDTTGLPVQGVNVDFTLSTTIGGLSLTNNSATTNASGLATAIVLAGNISTSVRVTATIDVAGQPRSTVSDKLVVSTGLPDQNSLSLSAVTLNPGGGNVDGITTPVTVRMADKFNNPVPDGTALFFTTEYGAIDSNCETTAGACTITWSSQAPRVPLIYNNFGNQDYISTLGTTRSCLSINPATTGVPCFVGSPFTVDASAAVGFGRILARRSTILVTAIGEESFVDTNGNGLFDTGEAFEDLGEAFLDNNENGAFDGESLCTPTDADQAGRDCASGLEETFVDFDNDGNYTPGNGIYNGSLCPDSLASLPSPPCTTELLSVRGDLVIVMSDSNQALVLLDSSGAVQGPITLPAGSGSETFFVDIADGYNNLPSAGATLTVTSDGCELVGGGQFVVPNTNATGAYSAGFTLIGDPANMETVIGFVTFELAGLVGGNPISFSISCTDTAM